jgi:hypothetical protein
MCCSHIAPDHGHRVGTFRRSHKVYKAFMSSNCSCSLRHLNLVSNISIEYLPTNTTFNQTNLPSLLPWSLIATLVAMLPLDVKDALAAP